MPACNPVRSTRRVASPDSYLVYLNGKIDKFSLDALVNLSEPAQLDVDLCFGQGAIQPA